MQRVSEASTAASLWQRMAAQHHFQPQHAQVTDRLTRSLQAVPALGVRVHQVLLSTSGGNSQQFKHKGTIKIEHFFTSVRMLFAHKKEPNTTTFPLKKIFPSSFWYSLPRVNFGVFSPLQTAKIDNLKKLTFYCGSNTSLWQHKHIHTCAKTPSVSHTHTCLQTCMCTHAGTHTHKKTPSISHTHTCL